MTVTIAGSAPTTNRPACFSGNRYCNEVVNRTEVIAHASASSDAFYSAIAVDGMKVLVDVVYDASDPPAIKKGLFANLLNSISITFDQDTDRAGLSGLFSCSSILDMTPLDCQLLKPSDPLPAARGSSIALKRAGKEALHGHGLSGRL